MYLLESHLSSTSGFKVLVGKKVFWVPFNTLGVSRYSNEQLNTLVKNKSFDEIQLLRLNIFEAIQLFNVIRNFQDYIDVHIIKDRDVLWQIHDTADSIYSKNYGCCVSAATWLYGITKYSYTEQKCLYYVRPNGSGHYINIIKHNGYYFFVDMMMQESIFIKDTPIEDGDYLSYKTSKYYLGACHMSRSIDDYISYVYTIFRYGGYPFSFFLVDILDPIPPIGIKYLNDEVVLYISKDYKCTNRISINCKFIDCCFEYQPKKLLSKKENKGSI